LWDRVDTMMAVKDARDSRDGMRFFECANAKKSTAKRCQNLDARKDASHVPYPASVNHTYAILSTLPYLA
jgi:hypothetical protein